MVTRSQKRGNPARWRQFPASSPVPAVAANLIDNDNLF